MVATRQYLPLMIGKNLFIEYLRMEYLEMNEGNFLNLR